MRIDFPGLADQAEVQDPLDIRFRVFLRAPQLVGHDQVAVLAAQAHGHAAGGVDAGDDFLVDGPGQDHFNDLHRVLVGHAQAVHELAFDGQPFQHGADLRPAAVHDHRVAAALAQQHHVAGEHVGHFLVAHGMAAVLDDHGLA